jgi:hypothetical protein
MSIKLTLTAQTFQHEARQARRLAASSGVEEYRSRWGARASNPLERIAIQYGFLES